jgi:two-component sensor histidine kinase
VLGRVHDRLTHGDGAAVVDLKTFLGDLCNDLRTSLAGLRPVAVRVELESHVRPMEQAVPLGLILNELLTNALKYAFPGEREGTISVRLERCGDELCLVVADDGVGLASTDGGGGGAPAGMGQRLVRSLTQQLGGRVSIDSRPGEGTRCTVHVP